MNFLNSHSSVRSFTGQEITEEQEKAIITTAERSPTSSNLHAYSIIGIREQSTKIKLAQLSGNQKHIEDCPLFLIFCADLYRLKQLNEKRGYRFNGDYTETMILATVDSALVAGRALITAQALGLGGVMVGGIRNNPDTVSDLLHLPELVYPVMGMSLGYPQTVPKIKPRLPLEAIYHHERYNSENYNMSIEEYDTTIDRLGYLKEREVEPENYPDFQETYSWSEHSARRMASVKSSTLRPFMKEFLNKKGFMLK